MRMICGDDTRPAAHVLCVRLNMLQIASMKTVAKKLSIFVSIAAIGLVAVACQKDDAKARPAAKASASASAEAPTAPSTAAAANAASANAPATLVATRGSTEGSDCGGGSCAGGCGGGACGGSCGGGSCGGGGGCGSHGATQADTTVPDTAEWTTLSVVGMRCGGCENRIKKAVGAMEGVLAVKADHKSGQVRIATRPGVAKVRDHAGPRISQLGFHVLSK